MGMRERAREKVKKSQSFRNESSQASEGQKAEGRAVSALSDAAIGNQYQTLHESAAVDELTHSGRYLLDRRSDTSAADTHHVLIPSFPKKKKKKKPPELRFQK